MSRTHPGLCLPSTPGPSSTVAKRNLSFSACKNHGCSAWPPPQHSCDTGTRCPAARTVITIHPLPKHHQKGITITPKTGNNMFCPAPLKHTIRSVKEVFPSALVAEPWPPLCVTPCAVTRLNTPKKSIPPRLRALTGAQKDTVPFHQSHARSFVETKVASTSEG